MSLFESIAAKIENKVKNKVEDKFKEFTDNNFGESGSKSGSSKAYSRNVDISIKVGTTEIKTKNVLMTGVWVDTGASPTAGICEIRFEIPNYSFGVNGNLKIDSDFAQIKMGKPLEIKANKSRIFTGFVEKFDCKIDKSGYVCFIVYGMDAKMWMMQNHLTEIRGSDKNYEQIVSSVIKNYKQVKIGKISLLKNLKLKTLYQVDQSDYEFLCMLADLTGSLFYISSDGKVCFCAPSKLMSPTNKISLNNKTVISLEKSVSVWGTVDAVTVTGINPSDPSKVISATSRRIVNIGSGKSSKNIVSQNYSSESSGTRHVNITDVLVENKEQAQARADAEYNRRNLKFTEMVVRIKFNPKICVGQCVELKGFGAPFDGEYLVIRVESKFGTYSEDNLPYTVLYLVANRFTPQGR